MPPMALRIVTALCLTVLAAPVCFGADDLRTDLRGRRARLMDRLGDEALAVFFSAPRRTYSLDIDYEYRQDSNLYYLTGIAQPDTVLVMLPGNQTRREILFISPRDPAAEHWNGTRLGPAEATARSGIASVRVTTEFDPFIDALLAARRDELPPAAPDEYGPFFRALSSDAARLVLAVEAATAGSVDSSMQPWEPRDAGDAARAFGRRAAERFPSLTRQDARPLLAELRRVKSAYEQRLLRRSVEISSAAHRAGMRATRPDAYEYEVEAAIERVFLGSGGLGWAYPSIVGSGANATILHYDDSRRKMNAGELLLVDAGVNFDYMTSDVTRTYPVTGTFSTAQREVYEVVLAAQQAAIEIARPGVSLSALHQKAVEVMQAGLLRLGLITDAGGEQYRLWFTHGACHYIGLDVHDVGDEDAALEPGVAFVIEPGLYIRPDVLDRLPDTLAGNEDFLASVRPRVERYRDIGIRIEDSFLVTDAGVVRLSGSVPRSIDEIEAFMLENGPTAP